MEFLLYYRYKTPTGEHRQAYTLKGSYHWRPPTQATGSLSLGLILTGEYRHRRDTDRRTGTHRGDTLAPVARPCWLSLSLSVYDDAPQRKWTLTGTQGHRQARPLTGAYKKNYFNILIGKYFNRKIFFTGTHRQEDRTPTQATGSPLLARSPSRSMMMHRKGNEHSQEHRDTDRLAPLQALTITDRTQEGDRPHHWRPLTQGDRLAPVGSRSLSVYDDTPQRK